MFNLTPYGMGMPQGNQNLFGLGSRNQKQNYGLRMPTFGMPQFSQGIDYMGQRSNFPAGNSVQLTDGSVFGGMPLMRSSGSDYSAAGMMQDSPMSVFQVPGMPKIPAGKTGLAGLFGNGDGFLGSDVNTADLQLGIGGLQTLGNLWGGFKSLGLAEKQFDFSKMIAEKNLNNSTQSYNTALEDRINSRAVAQGMSDQDRQAYINKNSLPK